MAGGPTPFGVGLSPLAAIAADAGPARARVAAARSAFGRIHVLTPSVTGSLAASAILARTTLAATGARGLGPGDAREGRDAEQAGHGHGSHQLEQFSTYHFHISNHFLFVGKTILADASSPMTRQKYGPSSVSVAKWRAGEVLSS